MVNVQKMAPIPCATTWIILKFYADFILPGGSILLTLVMF